MRHGTFAYVALLLIGPDSEFRAEDEKKITTEQNPNDGATIILIPAGEFWMGTDEKELDEQFQRFGYQADWKKYGLDEIPRHRQSVKQFFIYKHEVSNAQYKKFVDATGHAPPHYWKGKEYPQGKGMHPVVEVSWEDAQAYCRWAGVRLPSEA